MANNKKNNWIKFFTHKDLKQIPENCVVYLEKIDTGEPLERCYIIGFFAHKGGNKWANTYGTIYDLLKDDNLLEDEYFTYNVEVMLNRFKDAKHTICATDCDCKKFDKEYPLVMMNKRKSKTQDFCDKIVDYELPLDKKNKKV